jgi:hypothetical protein
MSTEIHDSPNARGHGDYERQDIGVRPVLYFLAGLAAAAILIQFFLAGLYHYLDKRERAHQPVLNPLVSNVPVDTRRVSPTYPESAFPDPKLETDERNQLNNIRLTEEQKLNSYGWVDQKAGTVRIPIDRAMDLLVQRGLLLRPQQTTRQSTAPDKRRKPSNMTKESSQ